MKSNIQQFDYTPLQGLKRPSPHNIKKERIKLLNQLCSYLHNPRNWDQSEPRFERNFIRFVCTANDMGIIAGIRSIDQRLQDTGLDFDGVIDLMLIDLNMFEMELEKYI